VVQLSLEITRLEVRDPHARRTLLVLEGDELTENVTAIAGLPPGAAPSDATRINPSGTAIVWLDVTVKRRAALPGALAHEVSLSATLPDGETYSFTGEVGRFATGSREPIALSPPFRGGTWVADEGCCTNPTHHRRSLLGINGDLLGVNRFAIDWVRLDRQHRAWVGDPFRLDGYPSYRQRVISAAPGTVVNLRDGLPDNQPQGSLDPRPPTDEFAGNHVTVRVRRGLYLLYAHLAPGSVRVREGHRVRRGQTLGRLGNSGNSSTPHLHFQAMTTPDFFHQDSVPYSFKRFDLAGRITEPFTDENLALHPSGALQFNAVSRPGPRRLTYPLDRYVVKFALPADATGESRAGQRGPQTALASVKRHRPLTRRESETAAGTRRA
jgi:Peptidase family M23